MTRTVSIYIVQSRNDLGQTIFSYSRAPPEIFTLRSDRLQKELRAKSCQILGFTIRVGANDFRFACLLIVVGFTLFPFARLDYPCQFLDICLK